MTGKAGNGELRTGAVPEQGFASESNRVGAAGRIGSLIWRGRESIPAGKGAELNSAASRAAAILVLSHFHWAGSVQITGK